MSSNRSRNEILEQLKQSFESIETMEPERLKPNPLPMAHYEQRRDDLQSLIDRGKLRGDNALLAEIQIGVCNRIIENMKAQDKIA